jgi:hypothetical protein
MGGSLLFTGAASPGLSAEGKAESAQAEPTQSVSTQYDRWVVRAFFDDPAMVAEVAAWKEPWEVDTKKRFIVLDVDQLEFDFLLDAGFRVEIDSNMTAELHRPRQRLPGQLAGIPGYPCYRTVEETIATAEALVAAYPSLATYTDVGDTWEKSEPGGEDGYDMMVLKLTNSAILGDKPDLFITSAIHAREYTPAELATRFAEYLLSNYNVDADATWLLDYHEIHLMLHANSDGRKQAETGISWRKNTNNNFCGGSDLRGIDLNRNFEFAWGCCGGSSGSHCSETFRGPGPASEPETDAIQAYLRSTFPDQRGSDINDAAPDNATGVYLDIHSYSELVLWPWGFDNITAPNGDALQTLGRRLAYSNGYFPEQAIGLYPTDGTTDDFAYGELGVAAYTYELGTAFFQACSTFENTVLPDNLPSLIYAAKTVRTPYLTPTGPEAVDLSLDSVGVQAGAPVELVARVDDSFFGNSNGAEPVQNVAAAEYYVDTPPWAGGTAVSMTASDGAFDGTSEMVEATINTSALGPGRHILFVRGQDSSVGGETGQWGPMTATFLYVIDPATAPTLEGTVRDATDSAPIAAEIAIGPDFRTMSDGSTGFYQTQVISGTYNITASAENYASQTVTDVSLQDMATVQQDFNLTPICAAFEDDVEAGNVGWSAQSPWAISQELSQSPVNAWSDSPGGNYADRVDASLTSPGLDLSSYSDVSLKFSQICDTEAGYDYCHVEVSSDGGSSWTTLASYDGNSSTWEEITLAAPQLDSASSAMVRFRLETDFSVTDDGWHVDDVVITGAGPQCSGDKDTVRSQRILMRQLQNGSVAALTAAADQNNMRVPAALVEIEWVLPTGVTLLDSRVTNGNGVAPFRVPYAGPGTYTINVLNITKDGYLFSTSGVNTRSLEVD